MSNIQRHLFLMKKTGYSAQIYTHIYSVYIHFLIFKFGFLPNRIFFGLINVYTV